MFYYFPVFLSITFTLKFAPVSLPWKQIQRARLEALTYSMPNGFSLRSNIFLKIPYQRSVRELEPFVYARHRTVSLQMLWRQMYLSDRGRVPQTVDAVRYASKPYTSQTRVSSHKKHKNSVVGLSEYFLLVIRGIRKSKRA